MRINGRRELTKTRLNRPAWVIMPFLARAARHGGPYEAGDEQEPKLIAT